MRAAAVLVAAWSALSLAVACSSNTTPSPVQGDGGFPPEGGVQPPPAHWACSSDAAAACLSGTAATKGFHTQPHVLVAELYRLFPLGSETPQAQETVATDGTWAFDGLSPWAHYFVLIVADFGQSESVATFVGPLSVPAVGAPPAVTVQPVQAVASEHGMGSAFEVDWASAHVFDPSSGAELQNGAASVAIDVAGSPTPMPWTSTGGQNLYFVEFPKPPAAQASYTITASGQAFGSTPASWTLVPSPPTFTPTITAPANDAVVTASQPLTVSWPAQAGADYVSVGLFELVDGGAAPVMPQDGGAAAPAELSPDTTSTTLSLPGSGTYLIDVYFTTAACPTTSDGCVLSSAVAAAQITAQ